MVLAGACPSWCEQFTSAKAVSVAPLDNALRELNQGERFPPFLFTLCVVQSRRYPCQTVSFLPALLPAFGLSHSGPAAIQSALANTSNIIFITAQVEPKATCTDRCHKLYLSFPFYWLVASGKEAEDLVMKCSSALYTQEHFAHYSWGSYQGTVGWMIMPHGRAEYVLR